MQRLQQEVNDIVLADPGVDAVSSYIGDVMSWGDLWVGLKPLDVRNASIQAVIDRLRPRLNKVQGLRVFLNPVQDLNVGLGAIDHGFDRPALVHLGPGPEIPRDGGEVRIGEERLKGTQVTIVRSCPLHYCRGSVLVAVGAETQDGQAPRLCTEPRP